MELVKYGIPCQVIEKKSYPFHRVCGEYVSNEARPFLKRSELFPNDFAVPEIRQFQLSSVSGDSVTVPLDLGGFGISRYTFDDHLFRKALERGVEFRLDEEVTDVRFDGDEFVVKTNKATLAADVVVGGFGKRSRLDVTLNRPFIAKRSPYVAVKYHVRCEHRDDVVALHNFPGGYCGISRIENGKSNLCYLVDREQLRKAGTIPELERSFLHRNPLLRDIFINSDFVLPRPEVINEVSFRTKGAVDNHILFAGDAAGMIAPLCGNGMAMAIHSGVLVAAYVAAFCENKMSRSEMEAGYEREWARLFAQRLRYGRWVQNLFGKTVTSSVAVAVFRRSRRVADFMIRQAHGDLF